MRKVLVLSSFLILTPAIYILSLLFLISISYQENSQSYLSGSSEAVSYAALPSVESVLTDRVTEKDARPEIVRQFLAKYNSPLEPYARYMVSEADLYNLDYRLVPAIAMQESNLCKKAPPNSYNCWGFGIYGKKVTRFKNYRDAIAAVTKTLANSYKDNGLKTPEEIMTKYTPSSNGSWAYAVSQFMNILQ